jgi:acyl-CoA synthetase (AMP-forming)/AMP-acid ligase II
LGELIVIAGAVAYPRPFEIILIADTLPFEISATAVAGTPQEVDGKLIVTVGVSVYPDPPDEILIFPTEEYNLSTTVDKLS